MEVIKAMEKEQMRFDLPYFKPGDTVKVHVKIREGRNAKAPQMPLLRYGRSPTESAWSAFSPCILPTSTKSRLSLGAVFVGRVSIT
jgi:hypothetical protein